MAFHISKRSRSSRYPRASLFILALTFLVAKASVGGTVFVTSIDGPIGPATSDHVLNGLTNAAGANAELFILKINTPGGLDTAMREIIQGIISSPVPVVVFVAPGGSRAASAGTYILYAAHVAAMAPATTLGAATPIDVGVLPQFFDRPPSNDKTQPDSDPGSANNEKPSTLPTTQTALSKKIVNDAAAYIRGLAQLRGRNVQWAELAVRDAVSLSTDEAAAINVIDLVAEDVNDLLNKLDEYSVTVLGEQRVIDTDNNVLIEQNPDWRNKLLSVITDPNILPILMTLGVFGLFYEMLNPGLFLPGVLGGICILLALYAAQILPINYAGLALVALGIIFMISEAFVPSFGVLGIGGVIAFVVGSVILIDTDYAGYGISIPFVSTFAVVNALFFFGVLTIVLKASKRPAEGGAEEIIGAIGTVIEPVEESGRVRIQGEYWQAKSNVPIKRGEKIEVTDIEGLTLVVHPLSDTEEQSS